MAFKDLVVRNKKADLPLPVPDSLVASAVQIRHNESLWSTYRFTDQSWQKDAWRFYHSTPELHYAAQYTGSACSRVRIYVAEVDELGAVGNEVDDDDEIMAIGDTLFGGPGQKSETLRVIGVNLFVTGECYVIGRARQGVDEDAWYVASTSELRRRGGQIVINFGYGPEKLLSGQDLVIRLWQANEEFKHLAISPTRPCLDILQELQELQQYEYAQIDSRLVGAGVYWMPAETRVPGADGATGNSADDMFTIVSEAARASRSNRANAAGVVPIFAEVPLEALPHMPDKPVTFGSELSDRLQGLKEAAIKRLAQGLALPQEILLGMGETNHLSSWQIEESFIKIQIEPMMNLICSGLTKAYLRPLLKVMGKDPARYALWFDTAPLTMRPNRLQDTENLYERGLVSADAVLRAGGYNAAIDKPTKREELMRFVKELILRDPTLIQVPGVREFLGIDIEFVAPSTGELPAGGDLSEPGPPPPPAPERKIAAPSRPELPGDVQSSGGTPILASAVEYLPGPIPLVAAANVVCRRTFEIAGGKLLTREHRGNFPDTPKHLLHTKIKVRPEQIEDLVALSNLEADFEGQDLDLDQLRNSLYEYCAILLLNNTAHHISLLTAKLTRDGLI